MTGRVSVVVCTYTERRWSDLTAALDGIRRQTRPPDEVVVVVDHAPDLLARLSAAAPDVRVVANANTQGLSGARNTGVAVALGELIAFLDDDAVPDPTWLECLVAPFTDPAIMVTGGRAVPNWAAAAPAWFPDEFNWVIGCSSSVSPGERTEVRNVFGCSMAMRAEALRVVGGFAESVGRVGAGHGGAEETELCIRIRQRIAGSRIVHVPDSVVLHKVPADRGTRRYFFARCRAEGRSKAEMGRLVGFRDGTSSERTYVVRDLSRGVLRNLTGPFRGDRAGVARAVMIVAGLAATTWGYLSGLVSGARRR